MHYSVCSRRDVIGVVALRGFTWSRRVEDRVRERLNRNPPIVSSARLAIHPCVVHVA